MFLSFVVKVEMRIDSNEVVDDINHKRSSTICGWRRIVNHSYREANQLADTLARHSYSLSDACCFIADCPNV
jgi:ribonuclease HI